MSLAIGMDNCEQFSPLVGYSLAFMMALGYFTIFLTTGCELCEWLPLLIQLNPTRVFLCIKL